MDSILIRGADIVTLNSRDEIIDAGSVAIDNGKLVYVGPSDDGAIPAGFSPSRVIDGRGMVAMPGLINAHTHAPMTILRGYAEDLKFHPWLAKVQGMEDQLDAEDIYWSTLLACVEMIKSGTTTFCEMYFGLDRLADAVQESGMRAAISRGLAGVAPNGEQALAEGIAFCEKWHGRSNSRITAMMGPHAPYTCPPEYLARVVEAAKSIGVGIHIHVAESVRECAEHQAQYGETPVATLARAGVFSVPALAAHCVHVTREDERILRDNNVSIAHCPQSNLKLANGIAPVTRWLEEGIRVAVGTDSAASNNDLDLFDELRLASILQKGATGDPVTVPAVEALRLATSTSAAALGLSEVTGELVPGRAADVILLDAQQAHLTPRFDWHAHLAYAAHGSDVRTVIIDGRLVMEEGRLLTLDEETIKSQVRHRAERLSRLAASAT